MCVWRVGGGEEGVAFFATALLGYNSHTVQSLYSNNWDVHVCQMDVALSLPIYFIVVFCIVALPGLRKARALPSDLDLQGPGHPRFSLWVLLTFSGLFPQCWGRKGKGGGEPPPFPAQQQRPQTCTSNQPANKGAGVSCISIPLRLYLTNTHLFIFLNCPSLYFFLFLFEWVETAWGLARVHH